MKKFRFDAFALCVLEFVCGLAIGITIAFGVLGQLDWVSGALMYGLFVPLAIFTVIATKEVDRMHNDEES